MSGDQDSNPDKLTVYLDRLYFRGGDRNRLDLFSTDGTNIFAEDLIPGPAGPAIRDIAVFNNELYFSFLLYPIP